MQDLTIFIPNRDMNGSGSDQAESATAGRGDLPVICLPVAVETEGITMGLRLIVIFTYDLKESLNVFPIKIHLYLTREGSRNRS